MSTDLDGDEIAIIGMACRMPGARDITEFWSNLRDGVQSLSHFTDAELRESGVDAKVLASPHYVRSRGIIDGADEFDASFFGYTPRDAELLDPQQRVFLECAWHALEDAGYAPGETEARIGVFGGVGTNWHLSQAAQSAVVKKFASGASVVISNDKDYLTTRVSYKLGLTGPSVNVQSACSTSLVATVLGMGSLRAHQCNLVIAGGATIELPEKKGYLHQEGGMESADGRCRPFDAAANGTVFSRGAGVVVLKRLSDAIRDLDHVYAVIRDGAINNDGAGKMGFTAPSIDGQVELLVEALERAGVSAAELTFVEAHGTATPLGDPIEVEALSQAFRHYTDKRQFCALGSVKGNIGHTNVASGVAGLIKACKAIEQRLLPASLNFTTPNPKIDFQTSPLFVNTALRPLDGDSPVRALVSAFGVGGTNACVVLESAPRPARAPVPAFNVAVLSARSEATLDAQAARLRARIAAEPDLDLARMACTLQTGRRRFPFRCCVPFSSRETLLTGLSVATPVHQASSPREGTPIAFLFPGQGNQFIGMGAQQYRYCRAFRSAIDYASAILKPLLDLDLRDILFAQGDEAARARELLDLTYITQPALFAISYAQAMQWRAWGIEPDMMIGHSVGEYVAACLAGVFTLEEALTLVVARGRLIQALPGGSMLAVLLPESEVARELPEEVAIAAVNSRQMTVVAGPNAAIMHLEAQLAVKKIVSRHLRTSHAFHSAMMDPAIQPFAAMFDTIRLHPPTIPIVSTLTGAWLTDAEATDPHYWAQHMRAPVLFADASEVLTTAAEPPLFLECGPGHSLASSVKSQLDRTHHHRVLSSQPSSPDGNDEMTVLMRAIGGLWVAGRPIDWSAFYDGASPGRVPLPGYPFERQKFALDFSKRDAAAANPLDERKSDVGDWFYEPGWVRTSHPALLAGKVEPPERRCWVIFDDGGRLGAALARVLKDAGQDVVCALRGGAFAGGAGTFALRPSGREDYDDLLRALKAEGRRPTRFVHLWNAAGETLDDVDEARELAFDSPLFLEQALIAQGVIETARLLIVTRGLYSIAGEPLTAPLRALAAGPARVIGKEFPMIQARLVDVDAGGAGLAALLVAEAELDLDDTIIAYRGGHRFAERYEPVHLAPGKGLDAHIRDGGVYLVTGGLGALGLYFAQAFAAARRVALVLLHRSTFPPREQWEDPSAALDEGARDRINAIRGIEASGSKVMLIQADVASASALAEAVAAAERRFGAIYGVVHSAGSAGGGIIALKTPGMVAPVLEPKVAGTRAIEALFADRPVDFILLFSSVTAVLGEAGRVDYCAANSFMDAVAQRWGQKRPGVLRSLGWAAWAEIGMASRWEEAKARRVAGVLLSKRSAPAAWLQQAAIDGDLEMLDVVIDPATDWIVTDHLVYGVPTLVGTSFIEFIHRFAAMKQAGAAVIIENAYFLAPLMMPVDDRRRLRLFVKRGERTRLSFKSQSVLDPSDPWQEHFVAELVLTDGGAELPTCDLGALRATFSEIDQAPHSNLDSTAEDGRPLLTFGRRWSTLREVASGAGAWLSALELPDEFTSDGDAFDFHPALVDVALASGRFRMAMAASRDGLEDGHYLPLGYRRVRLRKPVPGAFWSYVRLRGDHRPGAETLSFDVTLLDAEGAECAAVEGYTLKKVALSVPVVPRRAVVAVPELLANDIRRDEGLNALQRLIGCPVLPHVVITTKDLSWQIRDGSPSAKARAIHEQIEARGGAGQSVQSRDALQTPYEEPENEVEKAVAEIWQGILGVSQIGARDDFIELGGNSLLAVQMVTVASETFQIDLSIETFFKNPTIRGLAEAVIGQLIAMADPEELEKLVSSLEAQS